MDWIIKLLTDPTSAAHLLILYALVISLGVRFGQWKIGGKKNGIAFGVTWVLFIGILVGHICTNYLYDNPAEAVAYQKRWSRHEPIGNSPCATQCSHDVRLILSS